jgi:hypothetical protein
MKGVAYVRYSSETQCKELLTAYQLRELWSNLKEMEKEDVVKALTKRITVTRDRYIDVEWKFKI